MDLIYITAAVLMQIDPKQAPTVYRRGESLPDQKDAQVENILEADTEVVVFARSAAKPDEGITITLSQPSVTMLVSAGSAQHIQQYLEQIDSSETVEEVTSLDGSLWKLNAPAPADPVFNVVRIVRSERGIEIVCLPKPDSEYAKSGVFVVFTLMPFTFFRVRATANLAVWQQLQGELAHFYEEEPDDDDEEEEEEEEEEIDQADPAAPIQAAARSIVGTIPSLQAAPPPPPPPPPPPAPPTAPNGAATTPTTE